jgi:hypothetical protein
MERSFARHSTAGRRASFDAAHGALPRPSAGARATTRSLA